MNTQEIINSLQTLPIQEQKVIFEVLQNKFRRKTKSNIGEDEVERILLANGLISEIPKRLKDDEEESYEPIKIIGKPLSETILEERE